MAEYAVSVECTSSKNGKEASPSEVNSTKIIKTFKCMYCDKKYLKCTSFNYHLVKMHGKPVKYSKLRKPKTFINDELSFNNSYLENSKLKKNNQDNSQQSLGSLYVCDHCNLAFVDSERLSEHVKKYASTPFRCRACFAKYSDIKSLTKHVQQHIADANQQNHFEKKKKFMQKSKCETPIECNNLQLSYIEENSEIKESSIELLLFKQSDEIKITAINEVNIKAHEKKQCFNNGDLLKEHDMVTHSISIPDSPHELSQHSLDDEINSVVESKPESMNHHTQNNPFECQYCHSMYVKKADLTNHMKASAQKFCCMFCNKYYARCSAFQDHLRTHTGERPYLCDQCGKAFSSHGLLRTHSSIHVPKKIYQCDKCSMTFYRKCNLDGHYRKHTGERPFMCSQCGRQFAHSCDLKRHVRDHSGEKPYVCEQCGAAFSSYGVLRNHVSINHEATRKYPCDRCSMTFYLKNNLDVHYRTHTSEKPYVCPECAKPFSHNSALKRHTRQHTGERPFVCDICGLSFVGSSNLAAHRRKHTGEKIYECKPCGIKYASSGSFRKHKKKFHPI